jgi:hypothetical protein
MFDELLASAILANAAATPAAKPTRTSVRLVAVRFGDDDQPVHAAADRTGWIEFAPILHCVGIGSSLSV